MGFWGSGLYANDTSCDVRDTYLDYLRDGMDDENSQAKILDKYQEYLETEEEPLFWYALADTQWQVGRLSPEVKEQALIWLEKQGGLELWEESASKGAGWIKTMQKLKEELDKPMPKRKKVTKPKEVDQDPWQLNDVYAYQFHRKESIENGLFGKYIILQKIGANYGTSTYSGKLCMRLQVFDKIFDELPTIDAIDNTRILPLDTPYRINFSKTASNSGVISKKEAIWMNRIFHSYTARLYPKNYLFYLGNRQGPANYMENRGEVEWCHLDNYFYETYHLWHGKEYLTVGDGIFDYVQDADDLRGEPI